MSNPAIYEVEIGHDEREQTFVRHLRAPDAAAAEVLALDGHDGAYAVRVETLDAANARRKAELLAREAEDEARRATIHTASAALGEAAQ
jgi:hypothetical protein